MCCGGKSGGSIPPIPTEAEGAVRLEFVGTLSAAVTYAGREGRRYRGGRTPAHRFALVHPADVDRLLRTRQWALAEGQGEQA